jgi:hypothetical protein
MSNIAKKQGRIIRKGKEVRYGSVRIDLIGPIELLHNREAKGAANRLLADGNTGQQRLAQRLREDQSLIETLPLGQHPQVDVTGVKRASKGACHEYQFTTITTEANRNRDNRRGTKKNR